MRVVEAEFAFPVRSDVPPGASPDDVLGAVEALHLAVEVPDSRFTGFDRVGGPSLLADAACAGYFVLGPRVEGWHPATTSPAIGPDGEVRVVSGSPGEVRLTFRR